MQPHHPEPSPLPPSDELRGNSPEDLLARALESQASGPVPRGWRPPEPAHLAELLPQYRIEGLIGRGGMGAVYKGSQPKLDRAVAIKVLPAELALEPGFVARFEREARTLASLSHPGIVTIHDFGQTREGYLYFVMEYVDGTDLNRIIHGPKLDVDLALTLTIQICEALQFAHDKGVIHRDIKPANVLVTRDGRAKLADFGLASIPQADSASPLESQVLLPQPAEAGTQGPLTTPGTGLGTPGYAAPEIYTGHRGDRRTDIYALGVMLYEMLTGHPPQERFPLPSTEVSVDQGIDHVVVKALEINPAERYQSASEMKLDVERVLTPRPESQSAPPVAPAAFPVPQRRSRRMVANVLLCLLPLLGMAGAWWMVEAGRKHPPEHANPVAQAAPKTAATAPAHQEEPPPALPPLPNLDFVPSNETHQGAVASQQLYAQVMSKRRDAVSQNAAPPPPPAAALPVPSAPAVQPPAATVPEVKPLPSQLETFSQQAPNAMQWVLAPLDEAVPADIRQNLTRLREDLVDEGRKNPAASLDAYRFGYQLCYALVSALEERSQTLVRAGYTAAQANATTGVTSPALEANRNYMMSWPQYAREGSQRAELGRVADNKAMLLKEQPKVDWANRTTQIQRNLDRLYGQFRGAMRDSQASTK